MLIVGYDDGVWRIHNSWGKPKEHKYTYASVTRLLPVYDHEGRL